MKTHTHQIIAKMEGEFYPGLNAEFIFNLSNESTRGAVLIGTARVEEYLEKLILIILPNESRRYTKKLLDYPGSLSSLSSKIELQYAFRLIDTKFYTALNVLRKLRNVAAHTIEPFEIEHIKEQLDAIIDFEEHFVVIIDELARKNLCQIKELQMRKAVEQAEGSAAMKENVVQEKLKTIWDEPSVNNQLVIWKLAYAMTFMCIKLLVLLDEYDALKEKDLTWLEIIDKNKEIGEK